MSYSLKMKLLSDQMHLEPVEDTYCIQLSPRKLDELYTTRAMLPNGKQISLLKTLLSSVCERNCYYCPFRSGRDFRRASFQPDEFAKLFMIMHDKGIVDGMFLSSGVSGRASYTQDRILATADLLRNRYGFMGYLHLKIMPGAEYAQVEQAMGLADRISINLEAPNPNRLLKLTPDKEFQNELLDPIKWSNKIRNRKSPGKAWKGRWASTATQFVVGGADESDLELLSTTDYLSTSLGLSRTYYSAFSPVQDTPLESKSPTPLIRQNRLYQASFLLRDYKYSLEELPFLGDGNLPLDVDPKLAWALVNLKERLVEINSASQEELLRIPGIGLNGVRAIVSIRKEGKIKYLSTLKKIGIQTKKVAPFILLDGKRPPIQPSLFSFD